MHRAVQILHPEGIKSWILPDPTFVQQVQAEQPDKNSNSKEKFANKLRFFLGKP